MKNVIFLILLTGLFTSCVTKKKCLERYPPEIKTEYKKEVVIEMHDSIIHLPADSSYIKALISCDSTGKAYLKRIQEVSFGKNVKARIVMKDSIVFIECIVDSASIYFSWNEKYVKEEKIEKEIINTDIEKSFWNNILDRFESFFLILGYLFFTIILIYLIKKFILPLIFPNFVQLWRKS